jgi:hypothetical protein
MDRMEAGYMDICFPVVGSTTATQWMLTQDVIDDLQSAFPNLDVPSQCRKALAWIRLNPNNRKTAKGMSRFLFNWMNSAVQRGDVIREQRLSPVQDDERRRQQVREREAELRRKEDIAKMVADLKSLHPHDLEALKRRTLEAAHPNARPMLAKGDPLGGGVLTTVMHAKWLLEGGGL